jgi:lipoate-protein ligase B
MVPCGIDQVVMTSVARELGAADGAEVRAAVTRAMGAVFGLVPEPRSALGLGRS